jgi:hypothetical protein
LLIGDGADCRELSAHRDRALVAAGQTVDMVAGILFGLGIGLISSLLGVAGGEVIIPDAGLCLWCRHQGGGNRKPADQPADRRGRHHPVRRKAAYDHTALRSTVVPMGMGSIIGALIGGD